MQGLGRLAPTDDRHLQRYSLTAATMPSRAVPVLLGINWYTNFDTPVLKDNAYWIGLGDWGSVRGGHAIVANSPLVKDILSWYIRYQQPVDGPCGGYAGSRMMSLINRRFYDGMALYKAAQKVDEWPGENYAGTSIRAVCDVLRLQGAFPVVKNRTVGPVLSEGIVQNRWAQSVGEVTACLQSTQSYIVLLNSWGKNWPPAVRLPLEGLDRLLQENGEAVLVTDRPGPAN